MGPEDVAAIEAYDITGTETAEDVMARVEEDIGHICLAHKLVRYREAQANPLTYVGLSAEERSKAAEFFSNKISMMEKCLGQSFGPE